MYQIDNSTAALAMPAPSAAGTPGYFSDGNLQSGVAPTIVPAEFLNALMLEMLGVLAGAGIQPSKTANNQIFLAIKTLIRQSTDYYQDAGTVANAYVLPGLDPNPELVTNGSFASDLSGWTTQVAGTSTVTWNNGAARIAPDGTNAALLSQQLNLVAGRTYELSFTVSGDPVLPLLGTSASNGNLWAPSTYPAGTYKYTFVAPQSTVWVGFTRTAAGVVPLIDNVSVKDAGELVANGQFTSNLTGWALQNTGTATVSGGGNTGAGVVTIANPTPSNGNATYLYQTIATTPGQAYEVSADLTGPQSFLVAGTIYGGGQLGAVYATTSGRVSARFIATGTTTYISVGVNSTLAGLAMTAANVSVRSVPGAAIPFKFRTTRANTGPATIDISQGVYPLRTEQGNELAAGDIAANAITSCVFDPALGYVAVTESVPSQFGALAKENIGQGLEDDGAGNLRVKLADASLRRTASGMQSADPITTVTGNSPIVPFSHGSTLLVTGASVTITAPATSTLWNGYNVSLIAKGGAVTFAVNAADKVNGGAAGAGLTVLQGQTVNIVTDGAGNWWPLFQTTPQGAYSPSYITTSQTLGAGAYQVDTTAGAVTITLPAGIAAGTTLEFSDPFGTWGTNFLTLAGNGNTIFGSASSLVVDTAGEAFRIIYNGSDWRIQ